MSIYEASITNPKKQLDFYKDLSEQLQKEIQELKKQNNILQTEKEQLNSLVNNCQEEIRRLKK